ETEALARHAAQLRIHLTETYRIHRRLLRTRRAMLLEEGELRQLRSGATPVYEAHGPGAELIAELWRTLEDWRTRVAARVATWSPAERQPWITFYLDLAEAVACDRGRLTVMLAERLSDSLMSGENEVLRRLLELALQIGDTTRVGALVKLFSN